VSGLGNEQRFRSAWRFLRERDMSIYEFGPFRLDTQRLLLFHAGEPVALGPKVVETLLALVEHPGEVLAKSALLERIWPEGYVDEANLAQNIYVLRKTMREHFDAKAIETIPRRGYRFVAPVRAIDESPVAQSAVRATNGTRRFAMSALAAAFALVAVVFGVGYGLAHRDNRRPLSPSGERLYQIGRYDWNQRTPQGLEKSIGYFTSVIASDPLNAAGYAALAQTYATIADYGYGPLPRKTDVARANMYAEKALSLDPGNAGAYAALGLIALDAHDPAKAQKTLQRAIALDPHCGPAHEWYGIALFAKGRLHESYHQLRIAADLDPLSVATTAWLGSAAYLDHHFGEAISYARETLDLSPHRVGAYPTLGMAYEAQGDVAQAIATYRRYQQLCPRCRAEGAALLAHAYANDHQMDLARAELAYARAHAKHVDTADLAAALAAVGDRTVAISMLLHSGRASTLMAVENDPRFAMLRDYAGFRELMQHPA
jgi:DNA-binding winged helix-turn-helix (wHTH) protein/Flp pilus assembly protein TadD